MIRKKTYKLPLFIFAASAAIILLLFTSGNFELQTALTCYADKNCGGVRVSPTQPGVSNKIRKIDWQDRPFQWEYIDKNNYGYFYDQKRGAHLGLQRCNLFKLGARRYFVVKSESGIETDAAWPGFYKCEKKEGNIVSTGIHIVLSGYAIVDRILSNNSDIKLPSATYKPNDEGAFIWNFYPNLNKAYLVR